MTSSDLPPIWQQIGMISGRMAGYLLSKDFGFEDDLKTP